MANSQIPPKAELLSVVAEKKPEVVTEADEALFDAITSTRVTGAQEQRIARPPRVIHQQESVLAIHWHPEFVPMALIGRRIEAMYPDKRNALIIPTQHNEITTYGDYAGVEVDCYSRGFNKMQYFYRTSEVIEEAHALGAGIVIPHPEQFGPILLADYDVDGIEVWNPQSRKYTEFLISVINQKNRCGGFSKRNLLIFMGDDTHMAEKTRAPEVQDQEKAGREIGYQPAWDDFSIRKTLIRAGASRRNVIQEYAARLGQ